VNYVLDACALFALISGEQGEDIVCDLLKKAINNEATVYMSRINLLEIYYSHIRDLGIERADEIIQSVYASQIQLINDVNHAVFRTAAILKAKYRISLADSVALAYAKQLNGAIVTADHHEMDVVEQNEPIEFLWIR